MEESQEEKIQRLVKEGIEKAKDDETKVQRLVKEGIAEAKEEEEWDAKKNQALSNVSWSILLPVALIISLTPLSLVLLGLFSLSNAILIAIVVFIIFVALFSRVRNSTIKAYENPESLENAKAKEDETKVQRLVKEGIVKAKEEEEWDAKKRQALSNVSWGNLLPAAFGISLVAFFVGMVIFGFDSAIVISIVFFVIFVALFSRVRNSNIRACESPESFRKLEESQKSEKSQKSENIIAVVIILAVLFAGYFFVLPIFTSSNSNGGTSNKDSGTGTSGTYGTSYERTLRILPELNGLGICIDTYTGKSIVHPKTLMAAGGAPFEHYTWKALSGLPLGTTISSNGVFSSTGGALAQGLSGQKKVMVEVSDGTSTATGNIILDVKTVSSETLGSFSLVCPFAMLFQYPGDSFALPDANVNKPYGASLFVMGGTPSLSGYIWREDPTYSERDDFVASGLTIDRSTGVVRGTPKSSGKTLKFRVIVKDSAGDTAAYNPVYTINVKGSTG